MVERLRWRDPILEWRLSEIERRIQQRFRVILAESHSRRAVAHPLPPVVWQTGHQIREDSPPMIEQSADTTTALIAEIEKQIENEIMEDRLRNSDVVEWTLSPRSINKIRDLGTSS
jgi:hypothetical protein